jgi:Protein of unknown function (DUF2975)
MDIVRRAVGPLRILLVLTFAALALFQTMSFPGMFAHMAKEDPDLAYLRWPMTAFTAVEILCVQVVIVCTWKLLTMVQQDRIFSTDALRWVDAIIGAITVAWLILSATFLYFGFTWDDPGVPLLLMLLLLGGGALGLLMLVMRALLRQATTLRTYMEAVI